MSAVGEARDRIGELIIESINTAGTPRTSTRRPGTWQQKVNELLEDTGEAGQ